MDCAVTHLTTLGLVDFPAKLNGTKPNAVSEYADKDDVTSRARGWSCFITVDSRASQHLVVLWSCSSFIWAFWMIPMILTQ